MESGSSLITEADTRLCPYGPIVQLPDNAEGDHPDTNESSTSSDDDEKNGPAEELVNDNQAVGGDQGQTNIPRRKPQHLLHVEIFSDKSAICPLDIRCCLKGEYDAGSVCHSYSCLCCICLCMDEAVSPRELPFTLCDLFLAIAGLMLNLFDVFSDIRLAVLFFLEGHVWYGAVTLTFVLLAYVVTVVIALYAYRGESFSCQPIWWCCRKVLTVLMLGPVVRSSEYVYNGYKARKCKKDQDKQEYTDKMKGHHLMNSQLAMLEACIEAAPQLVFQLYVLLVAKLQLEGVDGVWRIFNLLSSWFSLALALTTYKKSDRNIKDRVSTPHTFRHQAFDLLWRLPETGGRVLCIACFASVFKFLVLTVVITHILILVRWQYLKERNREERNREERNTHVSDMLLYLVFSGAFLFAFFRIYKRTQFRLQSIAFYLLFYIENFTMLLLWYFYTPDQGAWFHTPILIAGFVSLPLHVMLQLVYYKWCHPKSKQFKTCIDCGWGQWDAALCDEIGDVDE